MKKLVIAIMLVLFPALAFAAEVSRGETISISQTQKNPVVFASTANIDSPVQGDLTVFAQNANVNSPVEGSAYLVGEKVNVNEQIGNRLIVAASQFTLKSVVKGDLIVVGGVLNMESSARVEGDLIAYGSNVTIKSDVGGSLNTGGAKVTLDDAVIQGDARIRSDQISFSDDSQINGHLEYSAREEITLPSDQVKGGISYEKVSPQTQTRFVGIIGSIVWVIVMAIILMWLLGKRLDTNTAAAMDKLGNHWLTGFLVLIGAPILMVVAIISYVGIYFSFVLLLLYILALLIGYIYGAIFLGALLVKWISRDKQVKVGWAAVVFGPIVLILIGMIPVLGGLAKFFFMVLGVGIFVYQLKSLRESHPQTK